MISSYQRSYYALAALAFLMLTNVSHFQANGIFVEASDQSHPECTLYMAPTSTNKIPEDEQDDDFEEPFKLSMYAGVNITPGTTIGIPDIAIPIIDIHIHNGAKIASGEIGSDYFRAQESFFWSAETAHANLDIFPRKMIPEEDEDDDFDEIESESNLLLAIPGVGALGNQHFTSYTNAAFDHEGVLKRKPIRSASSSTSKNSNGEENAPPGTGANSHYYDVTLQSQRYIPAGMEILVNDVGATFENDEYALEGQDFVDVDDILKKIQDFFVKHEHRETIDSTASSGSMDDEKKAEIYDFLVNDVLDSQFTETLNGDDREDKDHIMEEIKSLFPEYQEFQKLMDSGGGGTFTTEFPETLKSQEWLRKNGQCLDGIYTGKSTIAGAEKGAFATRNVQKGGLIGPAPLLLIPDSEYLDMYSLNFKGRGMGEYVQRENNEDGEPVTEQLLVNYSFGHPESSLLFYPYGMGVNMINHKPTGKGANAKMIWTDASYHDDSLLDEEEIAEDNYAALPLGMDIVATRDIAADEEIFLDYGSEWQQAWDEHVNKWDAKKVVPIDALQWNTEFLAKNQPFPTEEERESVLNEQGKEDPIPKNIRTACHIRANTLKSYHDGIERFAFNEEETKVKGEHWTICDVLERYTRDEHDNDDEYMYLVKTYNFENEYSERIVEDVPHKYIRFADKPYSKWDERVFRHPIGIPNIIFPPAWRDLA